MKPEPVNQEMCCDEQRPKQGPLTQAIVELGCIQDVARNNHDIAIHERRYNDAERARARLDSVTKALNILEAANNL